MDIIGHPIFGHQVQGNHGKLRRRASLQEQDMVIVGDVHQLADEILGIIIYLFERLGAVTHFHDRHAGSLVVKHFSGRFFQHGFRQYSRTWRKIIHSSHVILLSSIALHFNMDY